jgi:hypothetical protein
MIIRSAALMTLLATPAMAQEKVFDFKGITNIEVRNGITVEVIQGDELSIVGTAVSGDVDQFKLQKFGSWLAVNRNTRWLIFPYGRQDDLVLTITMPNARALKAYDASSITASGFTGEKIRAEALEGGNVTLTDFSFDDVSLYATDGGQLTISGTCDVLAAEAIISANITANALSCTDVETVTRMNGAITATATGLASVNDSAGGTIVLTGGAEIVDELPEDAAAE